MFMQNMNPKYFSEKRITLLWLLCFVLFIFNFKAQQPVTKVTLGIKPDYWHSIKGGVTISDVIDGKIAQKSGMKANDVIIAFDKRVIKDIFDYKNLLDTYSPGDKVKVIIMRDKKPIVFDVTF